MDLVDILNKRGISWRKTNNPSEILITCTSGEHEDSSPSLSFNLDKNMFHCWSCGFKGGATKFLVSIGETQYVDIDSKQPYKIQKLKDKIRKKIELDTIKLPEDRIIFSEQFKGIGIRTLKEFGAFTTNELGLTDYICIPVYQFNKLKFIEGRLMKDLKNQPKYYRRPNQVSVIDCLFPIDKIKNTNHIILVEGIFDMLNMWQMGYKNTLCIFGASNFGKVKLDLIDRLGVTKVDIVMDDDLAGQKAAEKIAGYLDSRNIYSRIIKLPNGKDPGDLTHIEAERIFR
jgi:DNA primase